MPITDTLVLSNFIFMGALPSLMFRRAARFSLMWWVTAGPFLVCGRLVALARRGELTPWVDYSAVLGRIADATAIVCSALSVVLIIAAWRAHRRPPALWHQEDDQPAALVTRGAYAYIRHPLYTSYLLALIAALVALPHPATLATLATGWALLDATARREERRLGASTLGAEYAAYTVRTGRFWPRLGRVGR
jgi:hypothetical protein